MINKYKCPTQPLIWLVCPGTLDQGRKQRAYLTGHQEIKECNELKILEMNTQNHSTFFFNPGMVLSATNFDFLPYITPKQALNRQLCIFQMF